MVGQLRSRRDFLRTTGAWGLMSIVPGISPLLFGRQGFAQAPPAAAEVTGAPVLFGAWEPGPLEAVDALERSVGRTLDIVHWYQGWGAEVQAFDQQRAMATVSRNALPLVTWEPWDYRQGREQPHFRLRNIQEGRFDPFLRTWARALREFGRPIWLRFAHEMNGRSYPWSVGINQNGAADYVAAWRQVVGIMREEGAANVSFVWSPIVPSYDSAPLAECFPGDDYVDVIGMDGYNAGTAADWGGWLSLTQVFGNLYDEVRALSNRPIIIAEVGCAEEGGDKTGWLAESFLRELPQRFPAVSAVVWFNERREADWRLDSTPSTLETARVVFSAAPFAS